MKSSSGLFPAMLKEAELKGDYEEDVYLLKPGNSMDPVAEFAVTRVGNPAKRDGQMPTLVLVHGLYRNRQQWILGGDGLAIALVNLGYDVWLFEMREHGSSPLRPNAHQSEPKDIAEADLPAAARFILEQSGSIPIWVGVDASSLALLQSLFVGKLTTELVAGFISLGGPCDKKSMTIARRLLSIGSRKHMSTEVGADEPERRGWMQVWRNRFNLLTRWRQLPTPALTDFLSVEFLRMIILAPHAMRARLLKWDKLPAVKLVALVDSELPVETARDWLSQPDTIHVLLPEFEQAVAYFSELKINS